MSLVISDLVSPIWIAWRHSKWQTRSHATLSIITTFPLAMLQGSSVNLPMMTSSNGNIFRVIGLLQGESTGHRWIPPQSPVTRNFDVFFDLRLNKRLSKQSRRRWFETSLWCHCNMYLLLSDFGYPRFGITYMNSMTSFKMADEISRYSEYYCCKDHP